MRFGLLALAAGLLSGCVTNAIQATVDGGKTVQTWTQPQLDAANRCDLRVCVLDDESGGFHSMLQNVYTDTFSKVVSSIMFTTKMEGGRNCDVGMRFESFANGDHSDVVSAFDGTLLAHIDANYQRAAKILCLLFDPAGELGARVASGRASLGLYSAPRPAAPAAAPAAPPPPVSDLAPSFQSAERPDDFALVVGVENYSDLPKASYAARDAAAVRAHLRALGVPERNLVFLTDAKAGRSSLQKYLEEWLPRLTKPDSRVYFYFSGHGAPDVKTGEAYLMPWDGDPNFLNSTAYPVKRLYERLAALPAKQVLVAMDSCFSGAGGRSVLASGARPLVTKIETGSVSGRVTALTASSASEISGALDGKAHGAFTYFLLQGLDGAAKGADGRITAKSLHEYLTPRVQDEARRLNRDQTPQLLGADPDLILR